MFVGRLRHLIVLTLGFAFTLAAAGNIAQAQRLPTTVIPENYKLFLDPDIAGQKFTGEETITVRVAQPAAEVVLNSLDLEISQAEVSANGITQQAQVSYEKPNETVRLALPQVFAAGPATLRLKFSGRLTDGLRGLYLSKTQRRSYAVTQFEGTYARMMFPGFDEPAFKATFDLTVMADKGDTAISNGRLIADEPVPGSMRHKLTFSTSPRMSTYLVALAIGDWQCLERNVDSVPLRVCAAPEKKEMGHFALEVAAQSVHFYNQWYGIRYPFGKLDMVAIPDYEWGGMENTAAIFYRDSALLLDESTASVFAKRGHAGTIAHEIAHQWFGDLVTAAWWDDIWLNEGFASWMQNKPIAAWRPEWHLEEDEAMSAQQIIGVDSLDSARAIHGDPRTPAEIKEMFDGITYQKGAAVLRMLEAYVGPETFRLGVNRYLQEHANGNATSADFWRAEAAVSGKPVDAIMPTFVMQPGVPVVNIGGNCREGSMSLRLAQQRFYLSPKGSPSAQQWQIPVCLRAANDQGSSCALISNKTNDASLKTCSPWYFANRDAKGYYRVLYDDPRNLTEIAAVAEQALTPAERIALVEDAWAMTRAGRTPAAVFLNLAQRMRSEKSPGVLDLLAAHLDSLGSVLPDDQASQYQIFVRVQFGSLAKELGFAARPQDSDEQKALRASLLGIMGGAGDAQATAASQRIVKEYLRAPESVEGTIAGPAFSVASENGDSALYDRLTGVLAKPRSADEYYRALFALTGFRQSALLQRTLNLIGQGKVRQQDYPSFFAALLANPASRDLTWGYLKAHWSDLSEKVTTFGGRGAVSALGNFCTPQLKDDVKQFFVQHRAPGAERALNQSLERMESCIEFKQRQQGSVVQWLAQQGQ
jgi:aminopeptidase N/puromycin-sensitive aminopeptidase